MRAGKKPEERRPSMYSRYFTEILDAGTKWWSGRISEEDTATLNALLEKRYKEGWELVTYDYVMTYGQVRSQFVITYRRRDDWPV